ncbi:MAG: hypothetical protein U9N83_07470 [Thermodesulfobacteriota bacterium]|nr:hypothetical protein [Thermodesulfobacteriota bacterium]
MIEPNIPTFPPGRRPYPLAWKPDGLEANCDLPPLVPWPSRLACPPSAAPQANARRASLQWQAGRNELT